MQRNRSVIIPGTSVLITYTPKGNYPAQASVSTTKAAYAALTEVIDETQRPKFQFNNCYHRATVQSVPNVGVVCQQSLNTTQIANYWDTGISNADHFWSYRMSTNTSSGNANNFGVDGVRGLEYTDGDPLATMNLQDLVDASYASMLPGIRPKLSIVNELYELKDFKRAPKMLTEIGDYIDNLPKVVKSITNIARNRVLYENPAKSVNRLIGLLPGSGRVVEYGSKRNTAINHGRTLRQLTRLSSEAYLTNQFAIAPLLRSIQSLADMVSSVKRILKKIEKEENKVLRRHFVYPITGLLTSGVQTFSQVETNTYTNEYKRSIALSKPPVFHATLEYSYRIKTAQKDRFKAAILDFMGLNLNPAIVWNAIPWSFVVDWVVGVASWLNQFHIDNLNLETAIRQYCYSVQWIRSVDCSTKHSIGGPVSNPHVLNRIWTDNVYSRRVAEPNLARHLTMSGLSSQEFVYIGALYGVRL